MEDGAPPLRAQRARRPGGPRGFGLRGRGSLTCSALGPSERASDGARVRADLSCAVAMGLWFCFGPSPATDVEPQDCLESFESSVGFVLLFPVLSGLQVL